MALFSVKGPDIPKGNFQVGRAEAVSFQLDIVSTLAPYQHRNFIMYGPAMASTIGFLSNLSITRFYRNCVKIGNYNQIYTSFPFTIIPGLIHYGLHTRFVRNDIIIQKWACPYCYHLRSSLFQVFFGVVLPVGLASVSSFAIARRLERPGVPALNNPEIYKFFTEKSRPLSRFLPAVTIIQLLVGAALAQAEAMENNYFNQNIEHYIAEYEEKNNIRNKQSKE